MKHCQKKVCIVLFFFVFRSHFWKIDFVSNDLVLSLIFEKSYKLRLVFLFIVLVRLVSMLKLLKFNSLSLNGPIDQILMNIVHQERKKILIWLKFISSDFFCIENYVLKFEGPIRTNLLNRFQNIDHIIGFLLFLFLYFFFFLNVLV